PSCGSWRSYFYCTSSSSPTSYKIEIWWGVCSTDYLFNVLIQLLDEELIVLSMNRKLLFHLYPYSGLPVGRVEFVFITQSHEDFFRYEFSEYTEWLIGTGDTEDVETER